MATNPLIAQGVLNKLRGSVMYTSNPALNVTASYLGLDQISMSLDGPITTVLPTQVGVVQSPEPYVECTLTIHLLRTQGLSASYKAQIESNSVVGNLIVRPDSSALPDFQLNNCAIIGLRELSFAGKDAGFVVTIKGYYNVNSDLWNL